MLLFLMNLNFNVFSTDFSSFLLNSPLPGKVTSEISSDVFRLAAYVPPLLESFYDEYTIGYSM